MTKTPFEPLPHTEFLKVEATRYAEMAKEQSLIAQKASSKAAEYMQRSIQYINQIGEPEPGEHNHFYGKR